MNPNAVAAIRLSKSYPLFFESLSFLLFITDLKIYPLPGQCNPAHISVPYLFNSSSHILLFFFFCWGAATQRGS